MDELVVISGKGGTGKTSLVGAFAALANGAVLADCDVDAADLHLLLHPTVLRQTRFTSGHEAIICQESCRGCGACLAYCRYGAVRWESNGGNHPLFTIDSLTCEGCGVCVRICPAHGIDFPERAVGEWRISQTPYGLMVDAQLDIGAENSGKLVSVVKQEARTLARENGLSCILVDGPPGVGCPVIASLSGASRVLVVTEPTRSGEHDLIRVLELTKHFGLSSYVCINKWDINPALAGEIEANARKLGAQSAPRIRYDSEVTRAQLAGKPLVALKTDGAAHDMLDVWRFMETMR